MVGNILQGQFSFTESFKGATAPGWNFFQEDTSPGPFLTAGGASPIDTVGEGWLRLTSPLGNQSNAVTFDTKIPSANNSISVEFDLAMWGGTSEAADGMTFFLYDASVASFNPGSFGGSLGYANRTGDSGLTGGYIGLGLDNYGNFSESSEGRNGGTGGSRDPNSVVLRGPDTGGVGGQDGYEFINSVQLDNVSNSLDISGTAGATIRPDTSGVNFRSVRIELDDNDQLSVQLKFGSAGTFQEYFTADLSAFERPEELRLGFSGATGGLNQHIEIQRVSVEATGFDGTWYWDNGQGAPNKFWGDADGAPNPPGHRTNWKPNTNPGTGLPVGETPNVVFDAQYVAEDQPITVQDGDKTVNSMFFAGQYDYTLNPDATEPGIKIILDDGTDTTGSFISVLPSVLNTGDHEIATDMQFNNLVNIDHFVDAKFEISGDVAAGANDLNVETLGRVTLSGDYTSSGNIIKEELGTLVLSGDSTGFTGDISVLEGTTILRQGASAGSGTGDVTVSDGATLAFDALSGPTDYTPGAIEVRGTGVDDLGAVRALAGDNTIASGNNLSLQADTTFGSDAGATLRVDSVISGPGDDLLKVGDGLLELNSTNTYSGTTTVSQGTLAAGANVPSSGSGAFGNSSSNITIGDGDSGSSDVTLVASQGGVTIARDIDVTNNGGLMTVGGSHTSGTSTISGDVAAAKDLQLTAATGGTVNFTGDITDSITGTATLTKVGGGIVDLEAGTRNFDNVAVQEGTLRTSGQTSINTTWAFDVKTGATLDLDNQSIDPGSLAGDSGSFVSLGSGNLVTGDNNQSTLFGGVISGTGNFLKEGTGTMTLSGGSTFTGSTLLNNSGSTLLLANTGGESLGGTSGITLNTGTDLQWGASNQINDPASVILNGGTLSLNGFNEFDSGSAGGLGAGLGPLTYQSNSTLDFGSGGSVVSFLDGNRTGGTLTIDNWDGVPIVGGGGDRFIINADLSSDFASGTNGISFYDNISFTDWGTGADLVEITPGSVYELVPRINGFVWTAEAANTNWNTVTGSTSNWRNQLGNNTGGFPNANNAVAIMDSDGFGQHSGADSWTISLDGNKTIGTWIFRGEDDFDINNNRLTLNGPGRARIIMSGTGDRTISSRLSLADNLTWTNYGTGTVIKDGSNINTNDRDITFNGSGDITISANINESDRSNSSRSDLTKNGSGTLTLTGNNNYEGTTFINEGILRAGHNSALGRAERETEVASGGTLSLFNDIATRSGEDLQIAGNGAASGIGALNNESGNNRWRGQIDLTDDATISSQSGQLDIRNNTSRTDRQIDLAGNDLTFTGAGDILTYARIRDTSGSGDGNVTIAMDTDTARVTYRGDGSDVTTGTTSVTRGVLELDGVASNNRTLNGDLVIGGGAGQAEVTYGSSGAKAGQIVDTANVSVLDNGTLTMRYNGGGTNQAGNEVIGNLTMEAGGLVTGATSSAGNYSRLILNSGGDVDFNDGGAGTTSALIENVTLDLGNNSNVDFNVQDNASVADDLVVTSAIAQSATTSGITKTGDGTLVLGGTNTFGGATNIQEGIVRAENANALGSTSAGTTVSNGAQLQLGNGGVPAATDITFAAEALTLTGTGVGGTGALRNVEGDNIYQGGVTLAGNTTIQVDATTSLDMTGVLSGSGDLTKAGGGVLDLSASNTFTGDVNVDAGTLRLSGGNNVGIDDGARVTLANTTGALLELRNNETIGSLTGGGALGGDVNLNSNTLTVGDSTNTFYNGDIFGSGDLVKEGSGQLTLSGQNQLTGDVTVNDGTLRLSSGIGDAIAQANSIVVDGGTLLLNDENQIGDTVDMILGNDATFATDAHNDTLGTLTLSSDANLDLGTDTSGSIINFADSSALAGSWTTDESLFIREWSGEREGGGTDQVYFGSNDSGLTEDQVGRIFFVNPVGFDPGTYKAKILSTGEVVPVPIPEPRMMAAAGLLLLFAGWRERRRLIGLYQRLRK